MVRTKPFLVQLVGNKIRDVDTSFEGNTLSSRLENKSEAQQGAPLKALWDYMVAWIHCCSQKKCTTGLDKCHILWRYLQNNSNIQTNQKWKQKQY